MLQTLGGIMHKKCGDLKKNRRTFNFAIVDFAM